MEPYYQDEHVTLHHGDAVVVCDAWHSPQQNDKLGTGRASAAMKFPLYRQGKDTNKRRTMCAKGREVENHTTHGRVQTCQKRGAVHVLFGSTQISDRAASAERSSPSGTIRTATQPTMQNQILQFFADAATWRKMGG